MLDERIQNAKKSGESSGSELLSKMTQPPPPRNAKTTTNNGEESGMNIVNMNHSGSRPAVRGVNLVKSLSDTTIYAPGLNRANLSNDPVLDKLCTEKHNQECTLRRISGEK